MNAVFYNPTKLLHKSIYAVLGSFTGFREWKFLPLSFAYLKEAKIHLDQADSLNIAGRGKSYFSARIRRFFFALQYSGVRKYFENNLNSVAVAWNARSDVRFIFMEAAKDAGAKTLYLELAPFPNKIAVDPKGINYLNTVPRDKYFYERYTFASDGWAYLKRYVAQRSVTEVAEGHHVLPTEPFIFVALQTEGDSQLKDFGGNYRTVESFLRAVCEASNSCGSARKIYVKEHPGRKVSLAHLADGFPNIRIVNDEDTIDLISQAELVLTVNSSVGLEAMLMGRPVAAAGLAFWNIEGICYSVPSRRDLEVLFSYENFHVDEKLRDAFLSYLSNDYYVNLSWQADGVCKLPSSEKQKIRDFCK